MIENLFAVLFAALVVAIVFRYRAMERKSKNFPKRPTPSGGGFHSDEPKPKNDELKDVTPE